MAIMVRWPGPRLLLTVTDSGLLGHGAGPSTATAVPDAISGWDWHPQQAGSLSDDEPLQPVQVSTGTAQAQGQTEEDFPEPLHFSVASKSY